MGVCRSFCRLESRGETPPAHTNTALQVLPSPSRPNRLFHEILEHPLVTLEDDTLDDRQNAEPLNGFLSLAIGDGPSFSGTLKQQPTDLPRGDSYPHDYRLPKNANRGRAAVSTVRAASKQYKIYVVGMYRNPFVRSCSHCIVRPLLWDTWIWSCLPLYLTPILPSANPQRNRVEHLPSQDMYTVQMETPRWTSAKTPQESDPNPSAMENGKWPEDLNSHSSGTDSWNLRNRPGLSAFPVRHNLVPCCSERSALGDCSFWRSLSPVASVTEG